MIVSPEHPTRLRSRSAPIDLRAEHLGRHRPCAKAKCTCEEGYSTWHMLAAGMLEPDSVEDFLAKASQEPTEVLTADLWEHTWEGNRFNLFRMVFFGENPGDLSEERQREILVGRTPAEIAFLADREFPTAGTNRKTIPACASVHRWAEALRRGDAQG